MSQRLAKEGNAVRLEYSLVFRAIAWHLVHDCGFSPEREPDAAQVKEAADFATKIAGMSWEEFSEKFHDNPELYSLEISRATPFFSGQQSVIDIADPAFSRLIDLCPKPVVAEGRTIGRYTYPKADVKFYVDATLYKRAERRFASLQEKKGTDETFEIVLADLAKRDHQDQTRDYQPTTFDPTQQIWMNTTTQTVEQTMQEARAHVNVAMARMHRDPLF
jgi:cytidylate kinase